MFGCRVCSNLPLLQAVKVKVVFASGIFDGDAASPTPHSDAVEQEEPAEEPAEEPKDEKATTTPPSSPIRAEEGRLSRTEPSQALHFGCVPGLSQGNSMSLGLQKVHLPVCSGVRSSCGL